MDLATVKDGDDSDAWILTLSTCTPAWWAAPRCSTGFVAHNKEGFSPWSREDAGTTAAQIVPMGFEADGALSAEAMGTSAIMLEWGEPDENPGSPITGYSIEYAADDDGKPGDWMALVEDTESTDTMYTDMMDLSAGMTRHYRVYAVNMNVPGAHKRGPVSDMAMATTSDMPVDTAPGDASLLTGAVSGTDINLSWTAGANAQFHRVFGIRENDDGSLDYSDYVWEATDATGSATVNMTGKASGTWQFFVIAGRGTSADDSAAVWSASWSPFPKVTY